MNIKEVVNLRKLDEFYSEFGRDCGECPFRGYCNTENALVCMIENILGYDSHEDLYEMERKGTLDNDFQIRYNKNVN